MDANAAAQNDTQQDAGHTPSLFSQSAAKSQTVSIPTWNRLTGKMEGQRSSGSRTEGEFGLAMLSIYTCRAEHQSLEDVRQRNDALDTGTFIHHNQPMHLGKEGENVAVKADKTRPWIRSKDMHNTALCLTSALTILSTMASIVSILWHFTTPSKYWERCFRACVTVMSRLL